MAEAPGLTETLVLGAHSLNRWSPTVGCPKGNFLDLRSPWPELYGQAQELAVVLEPCLLCPPVIRPYSAVPPQAAAYTLRWEGHSQVGHRDIPRAKKMGHRL